MTHEERVHYHMYDSLEGIAEHAERIVALEELAHDLWQELEGRVVSKEERTCETCDHCIYIGEGDFICDRKDESVLVIEDWIELRLPCRKWVDA